MATLNDAVLAFHDLLAGLPAVRASAEYPPEAMGQFPFAMVYPGAGVFWLMGNAWSQDFHTLIGEVHLSRANLATAVKASLPIYEQVRNALANNPTLGGVVDTIHGEDEPVRYQFGLLTWNDEKHIGWRFTIRVKINSALE
jgi:hypothetical protein